MYHITALPSITICHAHFDAQSTACPLLKTANYILPYAASLKFWYYAAPTTHLIPALKG